MVQAFKNHCEANAIPLGQLVVGREKHSDEEGKHFHLAVKFTKKWRTSNVRALDINIGGNVFHPNWKTLPKEPNWERWISYCKKEGEFHQEGFLENLFTFKHWQNYKKNKADLEAWERDAKKQQNRNPFPFNLPSGEEIKEPALGDKRCNWVIYGPPDTGKTFWSQSTFANTKAYMRPNAKTYIFEYGVYNQEPVIIYDDIVPKLDELINVSNVWMIQQNVPGESRYNPNYWKLGQRRVIIWLMNEERLPDYAIKGNERYKIFRSRFRFLKATVSGDNTRWDEVDDITKPQYAEPARGREAVINPDGLMVWENV